MRTRTRSSILFLSVVMVLMIGGAARSGQAQICPGSNLTYVIRDAKGVVVDARREDVRYALEGWSPTNRVRGKFDAPKELLSLEKTAGLESRGQCSFREPPKLKLTFQGKSMNLIFRASPLQGYRSADYLVDSLPFQQGTFEIDLPMPDGADRQFYPASGWKKISSEAEAVAAPTLMFIRGRVVDAISKNPLAGAQVSLIGLIPDELKEKSKAQSGRDGTFEIKGLRSDYMAKVYQAALAVEHPDFGSNYILIFDRAKQSATESKPVFTSTENVVAELTPLATVSGRLIDAATSAVPSELEYVVLTFRYREAGYLGGNIQVPAGEIKVTPNADGTFTGKIVVGKNRVLGEEKWHAGGCGKCYYMGDFADPRLDIDVPRTGKTGLEIKLQVQK